ncbi:D-psicose/D-tagatose/L-ribulose 3-epimerase [Dyadobacter sp. BE34]|uniref:D-psicose/D-tagatose/L-ribulose 3-epimerase n=1 Tax=Dyadobacter fermentans TaxID=94254 RepID=A0ABU1QR83_9BACT|nr:MULTISPECIES: sugar phosphate isomerase/epimerase [Dyadobacter]MDR6803674.1 D-psicose/D-tagatose/L-ribulose 3-epimerase [Dyadobacter fermentans]MDR7041414.1 D-psicose/D-tagatose/L-ribulose 3-epimerase [Dyadobacter sp. BE242]MDR7195818.1 D-psicose/D-tagatose/L-ribulose 3-epimerase [Dyadobacter sp. BE34]MDR7213638.1 D-psicose/D-tagatose/L-ribulose 3-epimerase [Dyadobacter sp. BE31]MDR7261224.1 D-psicose/D-tagatose/L-ribulose 3-epimerase [Dyadobacter sp. BE32]
MLFGASTFIWVSPFSTANIDLLAKVKNMGYDIIEIAVEDTRIIDWKLIKDTARDLDLKITISGAFGPERDISSTDPAFREIGKQYIIDCIRIAQQMDSPVFGGPLYSAVGKTRIVSPEQKKQERKWCVDILREVSQIAGDCGVTLGLEPLNRFETDMVNTVDQALSILDEVGNPNLKIVLDTFHSNIEEKDIPATIRKIGKDLLCHVQGNESDRGTPGTGHLEWQGIQEALTEIGYNGAVVIETFGQPSKELARAACIWRPLANSADELAEEGLAFYQKMFVPTHSAINA